MPVKVTVNGQEVEALLPDEVQAAVTQARQGYVTEAERNSAAAAARRDAEAQVAQLQGQLSAFAGNEQKMTELNTKLTEANANLAKANRKLSGLSAFSGIGIAGQDAEFLLDHPKFGDYDFSGDGATVEKLTEFVKANAPKFLPASTDTQNNNGGDKTPANQNRTFGSQGSPTPQNNGGGLSIEAIKGMTPSEIIANMAKVDAALVASGS